MNKAALFLAVIALAASALAQKSEKDSQVGQLTPQQCFTSGIGNAYLNVCITDNGNISWFESPQGYVHLQQREGYAVCSSVNHPYDTVHGFDANIAADGWGTSTVSQPNGAGKFPLIITRKSLDGVIQLKQTFTESTTERGVNVKMDLKNISGAALNS